MAIQFNCPYCTAGIRVPDSAAGKRGTCPKCGTKLIVPIITPPAEPAPTVVRKPEAPPADGAIPIDLPIASEGLSMAQVVRRRAKRRRGANIVVPIVFFGVVVAVVAYWMWKPAGQLAGHLQAERVSEFSASPALIEKSVLPLPEEEIDPTWESLRQHPPAGVRIPDRLEMQFVPEAGGLLILIRKTPKTEVFRVQTSKAPGIRQSIKQNADVIIKQQQAEFREAMKRFLQDWQTAREADLPFAADSYLKPLGFNRLTGPTGYCLAAQVGSQTYRAFHEDPNGDLYFLLPRETQDFVLIGRELPSGETIFPGRYTVEVGNPSSAEEQEPAEAKTPEEPPMEPGGGRGQNRNA